MRVDVLNRWNPVQIIRCAKSHSYLVYRGVERIFNTDVDGICMHIGLFGQPWMNARRHRSWVTASLYVFRLQAGTQDLLQCCWFLWLFYLAILFKCALWSSIAGKTLLPTYRVVCLRLIWYLAYDVWNARTKLLQTINRQLLSNGTRRWNDMPTYESVTFDCLNLLLFVSFFSAVD